MWWASPGGASGETSPAGHQELPGDHAGTAGQGALDRWTGMGHVFFRFSGRDVFLDLDGCHDAMIFIGFSTL